MEKHPELAMRIAKLLKHQSGKCSHCALYFKSEDLLEVHHVDGNRKNNRWENLTLLHHHCHNQVHSCMRDEHSVVEEPCEVTSFKHGFADQQWVTAALSLTQSLIALRCSNASPTPETVK